MTNDAPRSAARERVEAPGSASGWTRFAISGPEDLGDAVHGAALMAVQMSHAPIGGSLAFAVDGDAVYSSGWIGGRVALRGPLSESMVTVGTGLVFPPGTRQWLNEVFTGQVGVFRAGDEHDAFYVPGALYATVTLPLDRLEEHAARRDLVLDGPALGGSGIASGRIAEGELAELRAGFARVHRGPAEPGTSPRALGEALLDVLIGHLGRVPRPAVERTSPCGLAAVVGRAREFIHAHLHEPLSLDAIADGARTSRRTLQRAFRTVLDEPVDAYVRTLRLHRIREALGARDAEERTVAMVANACGVGELGRLAGRYCELFGELPSRTLARARAGIPDSRRAGARLARSAYPTRTI